MDALREIVKVHIRAARQFHDLVELERLAGASDTAARQKAELVTTCQFYSDAERILAESECEL